MRGDPVVPHAARVRAVPVPATSPPRNPRRAPTPRAAWTRGAGASGERGGGRGRRRAGCVAVPRAVPVVVERHALPAGRAAHLHPHPEDGWRERGGRRGARATSRARASCTPSATRAFPLRRWRRVRLRALPRRRCGSCRFRSRWSATRTRAWSASSTGARCGTSAWRRTCAAGSGRSRAASFRISSSGAWTASWGPLLRVSLRTRRVRGARLRVVPHHVPRRPADNDSHALPQWFFAKNAESVFKYEQFASEVWPFLKRVGVVSAPGEDAREDQLRGRRLGGWPASAGRSCPKPWRRSCASTPWTSRTWATTPRISERTRRRRRGAGAGGRRRGPARGASAEATPRRSRRADVDGDRPQAERGRGARRRATRRSRARSENAREGVELAGETPPGASARTAIVPLGERGGGSRTLVPRGVGARGGGSAPRSRGGDDVAARTGGGRRDARAATEVGPRGPGGVTRRPAGGVAETRRAARKAGVGPRVRAAAAVGPAGDGRRVGRRGGGARAAARRARRGGASAARDPFGRAAHAGAPRRRRRDSPSAAARTWRSPRRRSGSAGRALQEAAPRTRRTRSFARGMAQAVRVRLLWDRAGARRRDDAPNRGTRSPSADRRPRGSAARSEGAPSPTNRRWRRDVAEDER